MKQIISILAIAAIAATSCTSAASKEKKAAAIAYQHSLDSMQMEITRQHIVDSVNEATALTAAAAAKSRKANSSNRIQTRTVYVNNGSQPATVVTEQPATEKERKGWSAKAKGAVIGAGAGAITGAMVSDKKGKGAIIGGVIGAGAGLGAGAIIDKKQGR